MAPEFRICTIASGSSGNALYAECEDGAVLIDAGVSGKRIAEGIRAAGGNIDRVDSIIVSHDHNDHSKGAGVLARRHGMPLMMTEGTYGAIRQSLYKTLAPRVFRPGSVLSAGGFHIHTIATPHDGRDPVCVVLERHGLRCGVLTDLGHPFEELRALMASLDVVFLESNYDPHMLEHGPYHLALKRRIRSAHGHISNEEAAELVQQHAGDRLQAVVLSHLSEKNNTPDLAAQCMRDQARDRLAAQNVLLEVAPRHTPGPMLVVRPR